MDGNSYSPFLLIFHLLRLLSIPCRATLSVPHSRKAFNISPALMGCILTAHDEYYFSEVFSV